MALESFKKIPRGTKLVKDSEPEVVYFVEDTGFGIDDETDKVVTALILVSLGTPDYRPAPFGGFTRTGRTRNLIDTRTNRAEWSRA